MGHDRGYPAVVLSVTTDPRVVLREYHYPYRAQLMIASRLIIPSPTPTRSTVATQTSLHIGFRFSPSFHIIIRDARRVFIMWVTRAGNTIASRSRPRYATSA